MIFVSTPGKMHGARSSWWVQAALGVAIGLFGVAAPDSQPAFGQGSLGVKVDPAGKCPDNPSQLIEGNDRAIAEKLLAGQSQVALPAASLYSGSNLFETLAVPPLTFGERVVVYVRGKGNPAPIFVSVPASGVCGWLRDDSIWSISDPLRLRQIPGFEKARGVDAKPSNLLAKVVAMAVNKEGNIYQVPVFAKPFDPAQPPSKEIATKKTINYFAILNVYQLKNGKDGKDCADFASEECFVLVGGLSDPKNGEAPVPQIHGWVQGHNVALWPSALSLYYKEGSSKVNIYRSESVAEGVINGQPAKEKQILAVKEDRHTEPVGQNIPRFPVVEGRQVANQQLYTIVFAGEVCRLDDKSCVAQTTRAPQKGDAAVPQALRDSKMGVEFTRNQGMDILLVIDGTESMDQYYASVIRAVEEVAAQAKAEGRRIRIAAATFGDYQGETSGKDAVMFKWITNFTSRKEDILSLSRGLVGSDPHADKVEAPFAGIIRAAEEASWSKDNAYHLVVWIGDAGNRQIGLHDTPKGVVKKIDERLAEEHVAAALKADRVNAVFTAVQVRGGNNPEQLALFEKNAGVIQSFLGKKGTLPIVKADTTDKATPAEIVQSVKASLQEVLMSSAQVDQAIDAAASGREYKFDLKLPSARLAKHFLEDELKLSGEEIRKRAGEVQAILTGYVPQNDANPEFAYWLALRQTEFSRLSSQMSDLCDAMGATTLSVDDIESTMKAVVKVVTYEDPKSDEQLSDYFRKYLSVPKQALSEIMGYSIGGFTKMYVDSNNQGQYRASICKKSKMLQVMGNNKRVRFDDIEFKDNRAAIKKTAKQEDFNWDWTINAGIKYYFIPFELLP